MASELPTTGNTTDFHAESRKAQTTLIGDMVFLIKNTKKWWLVPIIAMLLMMGLMVVAAGSSAAPFIYSIF